MKLFNMIKRLFKRNEIKKTITKKLTFGKNKTRLIRHPKENPL